MGKSRTYRGAPGWEAQNDNKGKESPYSSAPAARFEGTTMSGDGDFMKARKGTSAGKNKSTSKRAGRSSGYGQS